MGVSLLIFLSAQPGNAFPFGFRSYQCTDTGRCCLDIVCQIGKTVSGCDWQFTGEPGLSITFSFRGYCSFPSPNSIRR